MLKATLNHKSNKHMLSRELNACISMSNRTFDPNIAHKKPVVICMHYLIFEKNQGFLKCPYFRYAFGPLSLGFANNKCADQPAHPRCRISAFVIHLLESIILVLLLQEKF